MENPGWARILSIKLVQKWNGSKGGKQTDEEDIEHWSLGNNICKDN